MGKTAFLIVCAKERVDMKRIQKMINRGANLLHKDDVSPEINPIFRMFIIVLTIYRVGNVCCITLQYSATESYLNFF